MKKPISFIIITYNRPEDTLELLQNIAGLDDADALLQDVVLVNNASTSNYTTVKQFVQESTLPFIYKDAPSNLGVTKGRNFALQFAQGDICIFLDDDAILGNKDALKATLASFQTEYSLFGQKREIAIVSFKVLYYSTLEMQQNALPHKKFEQYKQKDQFYTYYFAGGAHAIKKNLLEAVGKLPEEFFYGMEEYDLSFRLIDKGYAIKYDSSIVMLHKESPLGRKPKAAKLSMMWVNKCIVAYKYLPLKYYFSTACMWSFQFLKETSFNLPGFFSSWLKVIRIPFKEKRSPIKKEALDYLKQTDARLWY
jgi:GT2 family glycosyltransferase